MISVSQKDISGFGRLDAHHHFWRYSPQEYPWITEEMPALRHNFLPETWGQILLQNRMDGCIAVQARPSEDETAFLTDLATKYSWLAGVVGWVDLRSPDIDDRLAFWDQHPVVKGYRHQIQDEADPPLFMADPDFNRGLAFIQRRNLVFEVLIHSKDLSAATTLCARHDVAQMVLDHLGKPAPGQESLRDWGRRLAPLADLAHVSCKISGLVTEAAWHKWTEAELLPFIETAFELFGPKRVMFGSDWPVCLLAASLDEVYRLAEKATDHFSRAEKQDFWGGNAVRIYNIKGVDNGFDAER